MTLTQPLRIGIIGTGSIGGFYGLLLARAGFDVHFLLRSEFDAVSRKGLQVDSQVHGALHLASVNAHRQAADMPPCDWLLVGAKTTSNAALAPLITQAAAPGARVVLLQNGLDVEEQLRPLLPESLHLLGGLCFVCLHRQAPGVVVHQAGGTVNLGYHSGPAVDQAARMALVEEGAALFAAAGIDGKAMPDLRQARWQKLVWNVPYNGLSVLLRAGTQALMADPHSRALIEALMEEVIGGAAACGVQMPDNYAQTLLAFTDALPDYWPSMYHDFAGQRPMELEVIYQRPLRAAQAAGCELPRIRTLYQSLAFIDRRRADAGPGLAGD
ncbi:putative 2-dehydropantoate 2-reductase [Pseudomonas sp. DTU_2021_1001937_2_SI_NGA_ILE_001]|uniref:putative 2-dehydropantoate 2-reductase n=1 Tax=Pseudomonas sp. DTU_2021_1001937_2_SI_NGA_ILE_001 TaxID=3077589 RepID=UPI0028FC2B20|nr:putative 2-dehydropantoate 2-reductase [Pseudomonas sp. DTU_2021_1001937_2_SI_NGA_ILE_001]WNW10713.1 putative 2-dehydropantoate 2-reductase [Pseudomonas sp. DTU_2021_1001937_2_SI_NGA_ILE_001]